MSHLLHTIRRELRRAADSPRYLLLMTLGIAFSYLFFLTLMREGQPEELPVAVVDHDGSYLSRRLCHELNATQGVRVVAVYPTHAEARKAMQRQEIFAFLEIPEQTYSEMLDFKAPHVALYSNNAYLLAGSLSYKTLATMGKLASAAVQREVLRKKGLPDEKIMGLIQPVEFDTHLVSNPTANYQPYVLTTILSGIVALMVLLFTAYEVSREQKERSARAWLATADGNLLSALAGKLLPYTFWFSLLGIVGNIIFFGPCRYTLLGSFWMLVLAVVLLVLAAQAMGVFLSALLSDMHMAVCICAIYGALSFSMSGFSYPVTSMPAALQACSNLFPLRHYYMIYAKTALYGCGWQQCWPHVCALLLFVLAGLVGALLMARQMRREYKGEEGLAV